MKELEIEVKSIAGFSSKVCFVSIITFGNMPEYMSILYHHIIDYRLDYIKA